MLTNNFTLALSYDVEITLNRYNIIFLFNRVNFSNKFIHLI